MGFKFAELDLDLLGGDHRFVRSDVSGAEINRWSIERCEFDNCTFDIDNPPEIWNETDGEYTVIDDPDEIEIETPFRIKDDIPF
ncbi:hypothetical protein [Roseibium sp. SCP14]|uniref:hypothetical protein n=1 Tax=Roseibium sp. SCP14 TaxID=3141375 RepID=UPI003338C0DD